MKGAKIEAVKQGTIEGPRLPIIPEILLNLRRVWEGDRRKCDFITIWEACYMCYFSFLRAGEITVLSDNV